jgi:hypothetical protein
VRIEVPHHESAAVEIDHEGLALVIKRYVQPGRQRSPVEGQVNVANRFHGLHVAAIDERRFSIRNAALVGAHERRVGRRFGAYGIYVGLERWMDHGNLLS